MQVKGLYKHEGWRGGTAKLKPMSVLRLYLASASPRRMELLKLIGLAPRAVPQALDEREQPGESPRDLVVRLSRAKGELAAAALGRPDPPAVLLAADTVVVLDGEVLGKPADPAEAGAMLRRLRGREHEVLTGVFLRRTDDGRSVSDVAATEVRFRDYDEATILRYVATGEPLDKAGAYGIQGRGVMLTEGIRGSWSNVVGLPVECLPGWLERIGIDLEQLRPGHAPSL